MLDAKIASALNKTIQNSHFKKKVSLEEQKAQKEDRFLRGRQITFMIYDYFRVTGAHETVLDYADFFSISLRHDSVQESDTRWDEILLSVTRFRRMIFWKVCAKKVSVGLINSKLPPKAEPPSEPPTSKTRGRSSSRKEMPEAEASLINSIGRVNTS